MNQTITAAKMVFGIAFLIIFASLLFGQNVPPDPFPPLKDSPGDKAYHELKSHLDYIYEHEIETLPDSVSLPYPVREWPGMNRFEVIVVVNALALAQVVVEYGRLDPKDRGVPIWIHDVRGYKKANGWYGIRMNGQVIDEARIWFSYAGEQINLRTFCTIGSRMVDPQIKQTK